MVSSPKRILRDSRRISAVGSAAIAVGNSTIVHQSLEASLKKIPTLVRRAEGEESVEGLADRLVSYKRPTPRTRPTHSASSDRLEKIIREQIISIPALTEDAVMRLFEDAGEATDSSRKRK